MDARKTSSPEPIAEALFQRAVALWGPERADVLRPALDQLAQQLRTLSQWAPQRELEPAFFL